MSLLSPFFTACTKRIGRWGAAISNAAQRVEAEEQRM